jgi:acetyl-CoA/propionyl-CoA carboxylase, biotin carboxylase, biotin carboxyl carrier protein
MFDSVLIANRGEIARRVIRTLDRLGIRSVAVYTPADRHAPHVREADGAVAIASYLDIGELVGACTRSGAQALHPGYGFLSENPALARACASAGVTFVGPPPEASELMGDKLRAKDAARAAGVSVLENFSETEARSATYPLLVKAAAGGGGRGMRVIGRAEDLDAGLESARREAQAGFGDDRVFIERFLPRARHIEVQVIADGHGTVLHLGERECSLQRRHQKLVEECPSPAVSAPLRDRLGQQAVALARASGYVNAGTVEFIANADDPDEHYFLECNARLQVEHPVTELVTGLDLVELQLRVAAGQPLGISQDDVGLRGHAIEARINAEDAARDFLPAAGRVLAYHRPGRGGPVRVDDAIEPGSEIDTAYDSLVAKVIVHAPDRQLALARLDHALAQTAVLGVTTTTGYLRWLLATDEVRRGRLDTGLIERLGPAVEPFADEQIARAAALIVLAQADEQRSDDPFARVDGWRLGGRRAGSWWRLAIGAGEPIEVALECLGAYELERTSPESFAITTGGQRRQWTYATAGRLIWIGCEGYAWPVRQISAQEAQEAHADGDLRAPMPGQVLLLPSAVGAQVRAGDPVVVLESMKMELVLTAPMDGTVVECNVAVGDKVAVDQPLARVEADK